MVNNKSIANLKPPKKGEVRNPTGKNVGTLSRVTQATKELLAHAAQQNLPAVNNAIDALLRSDNESVRSRGVELYLRLLEFSQPRLSAMAVKGDGVGAGIIVIGKPQELELNDNDNNNTVFDNTESSDIDRIEEATVIEDNNLNIEYGND